MRGKVLVLARVTRSNGNVLQTMNSTREPAKARDAHSHLPTLDGLRGIALLLVLLHQFGSLEGQTDVAAWVFQLIQGKGWVGVQLFFVLSGFLITGILLDTRQSRNYFSAFYAHRTLRIFPLYFAVLFGAFFILPAIGTVPAMLESDRANQIWLWTYLENWMVPIGKGSQSFPHFWSLAVEEQFYLIWPLLIHRRTTNSVFRLCIALILLTLAIRCVLSALGVSTGVFYYTSICRMDALIFGAAIAAAFRIPAMQMHLLRWPLRYFLAAVVLGFAGLLITRGYPSNGVVAETIGYSIVSAVFALTIAACASADLAGSAGPFVLFRVQLLRTVGKYSYGMYVFHKPLHEFFGKSVAAAIDLQVTQSAVDSASYVVFATVVTFLVAFASYHLLEIHFLKLKRLFGSHVTATLAFPQSTTSSSERQRLPL